MLACALQSSSATPDEDRVLSAVRKAYPGTAVERAARTPMPGVYEIWMGANVAFVSAGNPRYMVFGRLVDLQTMRDLTEAKLRAARLNAAEPSDRATETSVYKGAMPVADAITVTRGAGRRTLSVFTDPLCGYCRQLEHELQKVTDVAIHYYLLPFQGREAAMAIWCAKDRRAAYTAAMVEPLAAVDTQVNCDHPLDRNQALATKLRVQATPTLFRGDGTLVPGVMSADELEVRLGTGLGKAMNKEGDRDATSSLE